MGSCECEKSRIKSDENGSFDNKRNEKEINNYDKNNPYERNRINQVIINKAKEENNNHEEGDFIEINRYLTQISKSICKLQINLSDNRCIIGTGFLLKFYIEANPFFCLMTNYHVIKKEIVESNKTLFIQFDFENERKNIILDKKQRIIQYFENLDITAIEILDIDNINEYFFLSPNLDYNNLLDRKIYIPQYPGGNNLSYSDGEIERIDGNEIVHNANTIKGSSGSPIFLKNTTTVIGIHKQGSLLDNKNYGSFIYPVINTFKDKNQFYKFKCQKFEGYQKFVYDDGSII